MSAERAPLRVCIVLAVKEIIVWTCGASVLGSWGVGKSHQRRSIMPSADKLGSHPFLAVYRIQRCSHIACESGCLIADELFKAIYVLFEVADDEKCPIVAKVMSSGWLRLREVWTLAERIATESGQKI